MSNPPPQEVPRPPKAFFKNEQRTQEDWEAIFKFLAEENLRFHTLTHLPIPLDPVARLPDMIDHTLLKVDADKNQIDHLCEEARRYGFKTVCVRLPWVRRCEENLRGTAVDIACVVGFHEGTQPTSEKVKEAIEAIAAGAKELDMVMNYVELKNQNYVAVFDDIVKIRQAVPKGAILKVILETSQLTNPDIAKGCLIAEAAGADFVKTSTGFNGEGAMIGHVVLMNETVSAVSRVKADIAGKTPNSFVKVKASGGIRDLETAFQMLQVGASRLGTSSGVKIIEEWREGIRSKKIKRLDEDRNSPESDGSVESDGRIGSRSVEPRSLNPEGPPSLWQYD